jgi:DedD protein
MATAAEEKKSMIQISRRGVFIWAVLILFIAGWMFVLGILVGRGTAPVNLDASRLQEELSRLKAAMTSKQQAEIEAQASGQAGGKPELGFYEALKDTSSEKHFKVDPSARNLKQPETAPIAKPNLPEPVKVVRPDVPSKPEKSIETAAAGPVKPPVKQEPAPKPVEPPRPAVREQAHTQPQGASDGRFTIQVAALKEAAGADRLVDKLRKKGYPAYQIQTETVGKGTWYRVRVGAFSSREKASQMIDKLKSDHLEGLVVATP